jgi:dienelactone hydrolase
LSSLESYGLSEFEAGPWTRPVYQKGSGPAVVIIHEMPGLHPEVVRFADRVAAAGMTVYLPSLFGEPGREVSNGYAAKEMLKGICVRREFITWSTGRTSPIVDWLRALARKAHEECGGKGVGAIGMCFTGGFALAMMTDPAVVAPVLSQPSLPLCMGPGGAKRAGGIDISPADLAAANARLESEDLTVLGLRFHDDPLVPKERFDALERELGARFERIELQPEDAAKPEGNSMAPHSVLTVHLDDTDPEGPTRKAERRVIQFFSERTGAVAAAN